ncbi:hypothetical protein QBC34DRAFT_387421 [Podospora aff. communis PSN243]|uniref:Uncharacterized protein n=1 Tax=Podospora aff. communis PSN243 TaxID=3040156 RepID=A0AAV9FYU4_9PEZI|nr:hypothetical protein QBC34DRAFT_387421 [Podospora aff. communis PSN243]
MFLTVFTVLASLLTANAAIIEMFSDKECKDHVGTVNVWDNTCARTTGFESFVITAEGGFQQTIRAHLRNDCVVPYTQCASASATGRCTTAYNNQGASHAFSSYWSMDGCETA